MLVAAARESERKAAARRCRVRGRPAITPHHHHPQQHNPQATPTHPAPPRSAPVRRPHLCIRLDDRVNGAVDLHDLHVVAGKHVWRPATARTRRRTGGKGRGGAGRAGGRREEVGQDDVRVGWREAGRQGEETLVCA